jgi:hypothetical protein
MQTALEALGSAQNITLTRLAKHRRVLFVEGPDDFRLIRLLARQAGYPELSAATDLTSVHGDGFASWEKIDSTAWGIRKTLGQDLQIAAILDRDFWSVEEIEDIQSQLSLHIALAHVHKWKELENYLLISWRTIS